MTIYKVVEYPNPRLRIPSKPVTEFDDNLRQIVENMFETMYTSSGIGLAAPQVDIHKQIIVIDLTEDKSDQKVIINPKITFKEGSASIDEGCLSVPLDYRAKVERASHIVVECFNEKGEQYTIDATEELLAICLQHEIDHLEGKLFIDYLSGLKRSMYEKKLSKYQRYKRRAESAS
jgi:peptide deformylase